MKSDILKQQIKDAKINFNYFFMTMIIKIIKKLIILASILLISQIVHDKISFIISISAVIITSIIIGVIINKYKQILDDIRISFINEEFYFILDTSVIKSSLFKKMVKYGK